MATLEQLTAALINADKAGDVEAARTLATAIQAMRMPTKQYNTPPPSPTEEPSIGGWLKRMGSIVSENANPALAGATAGGLVGMPAGPGGVAAGMALGSLASPLLKPMLDKLSPPAQDQTTGEKMLGAGVSALVGAGTQLPAFATLAKTAANPVMKGISQLMASAPKTQLAVSAPSAMSGEFVKEKTDSPVLGMLASVATAVTGGGISSLFTKGVTAPTVEQLRQTAARQYAAAKDAGVIVKPEAFGDAAQKIASALKSEGYHPKLHPRVTAALEELAANPGPKTLEDIDLLRRVARNAGASIQLDERRIGAVLIEKLDDFVEGLKPEQLIAGQADDAVSALTAARSTWTKVKKAELIDSLFDKSENSAAQFSQSGMENALRTRFKALANNDKLMRQFNEEEKRAIKMMARGDFTQNSLRWAGKLAPSGVISQAVSGGFGYAMGGPAGAVALPAAGFAAKQAAAARAEKKFEELSSLIRLGYIPSGPDMLSPAAIRGLLSGQ